MKKKTLMSIVLLALIGTSAVFAQAPTLDKLKLTLSNNQYRAEKLNNDISGPVVIPGTYNGLPVTQVNSFERTAITSVIILEGVTILTSNTFRDCKELTSVTIPASVTSINSIAFLRCEKLTSVTFGGSNTILENNAGFGYAGAGDLGVAYKAGGAGTYTRPAGGNNWTKQGGFSLNGTWTRADGMQITIADNGANIVITGDKPNNGGKLNDTYNKR